MWVRMAIEVVCPGLQIESRIESRMKNKFGSLGIFTYICVSQKRGFVDLTNPAFPIYGNPLLQTCKDGI